MRIYFNNYSKLHYIIKDKNDKKISNYDLFIWKKTHN